MAIDYFPKHITQTRIGEADRCMQDCTQDFTDNKAQQNHLAVTNRPVQIPDGPPGSLETETFQMGWT